MTCGCTHPDTVVIAERLGNFSGIGHVCEYLNERAPGRLPVLFERVIYDFAHTGDWIEKTSVEALKAELAAAKPLSSDAYVTAFLDRMMALCDASIETGNPIVF